MISKKGAQDLERLKDFDKLIRVIMSKLYRVKHQPRNIYIFIEVIINHDYLFIIMIIIIFMRTIYIHI